MAANAMRVQPQLRHSPETAVGAVLQRESNDDDDDDDDDDDYDS